MKYLIIALFVFANVNSFGQEKNTNRHQFLIDFGISHSSKWKKENIPADERYWYTDQVTPLPPYTLYPSFDYFAGFTYRFFFKNNFYSDISLKYSLFPRVENYNVDSLHKYHVFPDSLNIELPIKNKNYEHYFDLGVSVGYNYKRFFASLGLYYNIFSFSRSNSYYLNKSNQKFNYGFIYFNSFYPTLKLDYLVYKKHPLFFSFEMSNSIIIGIKIKIL